jgi:hypothetical protein
MHKYSVYVSTYGAHGVMPEGSPAEAGGFDTRRRHLGTAGMLRPAGGPGNGSARMRTATAWRPGRPAGARLGSSAFRSIQAAR